MSFFINYKLFVAVTLPIMILSDGRNKFSYNNPPVNVWFPIERSPWEKRKRDGRSWLLVRAGAGARALTLSSNFWCRIPLWCFREAGSVIDRNYVVLGDELCKILTEGVNSQGIDGEVEVAFLEPRSALRCRSSRAGALLSPFACSWMAPGEILYFHIRALR